ncbi:hypothetical protein [Lachnoclostridium phytofermentans]|uniref:hypothetical protein n=1 Tax=Lachnoclostridium phytofermentans TaxID=66219 RepID=UPI00049647BA|nr:hypothetical protein [Lachnoclostridium phytofermentans]
MKNSVFYDICNRLDSCNKSCYSDSITCTKKILKHQIGGDYNKFLEIKAECIDSDYSSGAANFISQAALVVAVYSFATDILDRIIDYVIIKIIISLFYFLIASVFSIYCLRKITNKKSIIKWRKYILVVLDDMEKNWSTYFN